MVLILDVLTSVIHDVNLRQNCKKKKNPPEMNMLNKNARNKITVQFFGRKQAQCCILRGWGLQW